MDYNNLFTKFFSDLKENAGIKVVTEDFYLKEQVLPEFIEKYPFLKEIQDEIFVLNDNSHYWEYQSGSESYPMGELHFISIEQIVADSADLKQFDDHPQGGDGVAACIQFSNDNHELWLLNENGEQFRMSLDLPGYFTELVNLKAIYGWQYLFTDVAWKQPQYSVVKKDLKERLSKLKTLFPDFDIAKYNKMIL
ncbi:hypothetical protein FAM09_00270 [Niastella caeni]|uniref:SMI1/KNR4 family protein n=1 Tax=Niastella caeni TaxID=2569763 RepID=A0A4S8HYJ5_9BACT|nr:hypothetical protein [Niastella caeni]THU40585.1 hypothetical protein FAM09_00270 [Niastella caeni]